MVLRQPENKAIVLEISDTVNKTVPFDRQVSILYPDGKTSIFGISKQDDGNYMVFHSEEFAAGAAYTNAVYDGVILGFDKIVGEGHVVYSFKSGKKPELAIRNSIIFNFQEALEILKLEQSR